MSANSRLKVLFIDPDVAVLKAAFVHMRKFFQVICVKSADHARLVLDLGPFDAVVCAAELPSGCVPLLKEIASGHPDMVCVMMSYASPSEHPEGVDGLVLKERLRYDLPNLLARLAQQKRALV